MAKMELTQTVDMLIKKQMAAKGLKRDVDVQEVYLCESGIADVGSLARFRNLRNLWLNGNKLRRIECLRDNFRLSELYLQNNQLVDIAGSLSHLTGLHVLMLQNNQLTNLQNVIREFNKMSNLKTLNLFDNPVAQEPDYRIFVVKNVPSVELLDRKEVSAVEKKQARAIYREDREAVSRRIAFGRRAQSPAADYRKPLSRKLLLIDTTHLGNSFVRDNPPYEIEDDAIHARRNRGLISMFTHFDWSQVPRIQDRRMSDKPFDSPQLITHVYR